MRTKLLGMGVIGVGLLVLAVIIMNGTFAQTTSINIRYPVTELGNCENEAACKTYCDNSSHTAACLAFAQKNNLMSQNEINAAKKFMEAGSKGPGECIGEVACQAYCDNISHINECVAFAEKIGILLPDQLAEAKQVQAAIAKGVQPPPCNGKKECDAYCEDPSHMKVCVAFGEAAGFLKGKELEDAKKILIAIDNGVTPPPCKGKDACDTYCSNPDHIEACMIFSQAAGLMSPEEAQNSQKMIAAVKKGVKPPQCRGKEECDAYCAEDAHVDECINFSVAAGFMTEKEAGMAKKTRGKGPGECVGKDECDAFCNNPDNQQTCFNFAKENGMISEEDARQMEEGRNKFQESMQNLPSEVEGCIKTVIGSNLFEKLKSGQAVPPKEMTEKMGSCFSKMQPPPGQEQGMPGEPGAGGMIPPAGQTGPDQKFQPGPGEVNPGGQMMPQQAGPGGCKGPEECKDYCESHPDECKNSDNGNQQFAPRIQPNMPQPSQGGEKGTAPGISPAPCEGENCSPPAGEGTMPGTTQYAPGTNPQQMMPKEGETGPVPLVPPTEQTAPPMEPTAPQSLEYNLRNPLRATIEYFGEILSK